MASTIPEATLKRLRANVRCRQNNASCMFEQSVDMSPITLDALGNRGLRTKSDAEVLDSALTSTITPPQECCSMSTSEVDIALASMKLLALLTLHNVDARQNCHIRQ